MNIRGSFRPCVSRKSSLRRKTDLTGVRSEVYGLRLTGLENGAVNMDNIAFVK